MQTQLPFFPESTKLINAKLGFRRQDDFVYFLHNGNPIYCLSEVDKNSYRFILGNLIVNGLCSITELSEALGENHKNIERYAKTLREKGAGHFYARKETRGQCYKLTGELLTRIQNKLNEGLTMYRIAKECDISEASIRYHIKKGTLKKNSCCQG